MTAASSVALEGIRIRRERSRSSNLTERLTLVPIKEHDYTLIFLHGFMMRAHDLLDDFTQVQERCPTWRIVLPQAPKMAITAHGGSATPSWYDYLTDTSGACEDYVDTTSLRVRCVQLDELIRAEEELLYKKFKQRDYGRIFLGGLSQGGTLALDVASRSALGGVVTMAAPRLSVSLRRELQCPWHGLFAREDEIFPTRWAAPLQADATATWCEGDHSLEGVDTVAYLATTLQKFQASRKDS